MYLNLINTHCKLSKSLSLFSESGGKPIVDKSVIDYTIKFIDMAGIIYIIETKERQKS